MSGKNEITERTEAEIQAILVPRLAAAKSRYEMTTETATLLFFTYGIYPSAKVVHAYTKHGSMTDINADLREFWATLRKLGRAKLTSPVLPETVLEQFSTALGGVWDTALTSANAALDGEREEMAAHEAKLKKKMESAAAAEALATTRAEASEQEMRQERERREIAEKRIEALTAELETLQSSLLDWQGKLATEAAARKETEAQFSRDLEAQRAESQRDRDLLEGEVKFAKIQIDLARTAERVLTQQLKEEKAARETELAAYRQRANKAEEQRGAALLEAAELRGRIEELQTRVKSLATTRVRAAPFGKKGKAALRLR